MVGLSWERGLFRVTCRRVVVGRNVLIDVVWLEEGLRGRGIVFDGEEGLLRGITSVLDVCVCVCDVVSYPAALRVFSHDGKIGRMGTTIYFTVVTFP